MKQLALIALSVVLLTGPGTAGCKLDHPAPSKVLPPAASEASEAPPARNLQGFSRARLDALTATLRARVEAGRMPGGVMLIARNGQVVLEEALGVQDPKSASPSPMPKDAIFRIYSMTKPIVSAGVMMLVEDGKVQLGDLGVEVLPRAQGAEGRRGEAGPGGKPVLELVPAQREMTVQDLLRHTSGLTYGIFGKSLVKDEYIEAQRRRPGHHERGVDQAAGHGAAPFPAGHDVGVQPLDRRARCADRTCERRSRWMRFCSGGSSALCR